MKKKAITLVALLAALVLLFGAYFLVTQMNTEGEGEDTTAVDTTVTILSLDVETMTELGYSVDGEELRFTLTDNTWHWNEDTSLNLDSTKFAAMVEGLQPLTSTVTIEAPDAEMLADFGLDTPANRVTLTDGTGTHTLLLGSYNSYNGCYYAALDTTDTVYMIDAAVAEGFDLAVIDLLVYDTLPTITSGKIDWITLTRDGESRTYAYYGSGNSDDCYTDTFKWFAWQDDGTEIPIATTAGNSLASAITSLSFSECVSYGAEQDTAKYGLDTPATLTIDYRADVETTDIDGNTVTTEVKHSTTLLVGDVDPDSGCYYATVEGSSLIYLLSSSTLPSLLEPDSEIRLPVQVSPVNFDYVSKITFETANDRLTVSLSHDAETTYTVAGETVEYDTLSDLFSAVQSLVAESSTTESTPDASESSTPTLTITFRFSYGPDPLSTLTITPYNTNFDRVSFMGRDDQLISIRDTEDLVKLVEAYN